MTLFIFFGNNAFSTWKLFSLRGSKQQLKKKPKQRKSKFKTLKLSLLCFSHFQTHLINSAEQVSESTTNPSLALAVCAKIECPQNPNCDNCGFRFHFNFFYMVLVASIPYEILFQFLFCPILYKKCQSTHTSKCHKPHII